MRAKRNGLGAVLSTTAMVCAKCCRCDEPEPTRDGYTEVQAAGVLARKPDAELSHMLDIVQAQIPTAAAQGNDAAVVRLQQHERVITAARMARPDFGGLEVQW